MPESPITSLYVLEGKNATVPDGYTKIDVDLNESAGGRYLYLCYSTSREHGAPITAVNAIVNNESTPPGYEKIPVDVNKGAGGDYIYIVFTKDYHFNPITKISVVRSSSPDVWPPNSSWYRVSVDLNKKAGGKYIYMIYG